MLADVVAAGTPAVRRTVFRYADGEVADVTIRPRSGVDALYAPRRHLLDRLLVEAAEQAGARVLHETAVTSLRRDGSGRVAGVVGRTRSGARVELAAGLTIGADGIRSRVAEQVGARTTWQGRTSSAVLYRYVEDPLGDGFEWTYGDGAGSGVIPTNDGASCVFVGTTPARMRRLRRLGVERAFAELLVAAGPAAVGAGARAPAGRPGPRLGRPARLRPRVLRARVGARGGRGLLQGPDHLPRHHRRAAGRRAARRAGARRPTPARVPEHAALARYQETRDRLSRELFAVTERVAAYDWDAPGIRSLLRRFSAAMGDEVEHLEQLDRVDVAG